MLDRFRAADTQVLGVSIDSVHSHLNWGKDCGGVSFPLLADFEPKGQMASSYGHYLADAGITDRATVIIDMKGEIRYSVAVTPGGERNIEELAGECEKINAEQSGGALPTGSGVPAGTELYVKSNCGPSRRVLLALDNLGLTSSVTIKNVTEDAAAASALVQHGKDQAPCLVIDGAPLFESGDIVKTLVDRVAPV